MAGAGGGSQARVRFEDVIVHFPKEEWEMLEKWQRELYFEVLKDNYESLIATGNPISRSDFIAWFEQYEREKSTERPRSGAGEPSGRSCATGGELRQRALINKQCAEALELAGTVDGRSTGEEAQFGDLEETPECSQVAGRPRRDQPVVPELEKATQGSVSPTRSQGPPLTPEPHKCPECGQRFRLEGLLRLHQRISLQKPSLPCPQCGACFPRGRQLSLHQRSHHHELTGSRCGDGPGTSRVEERLYFCAGCGESFHRHLGFLQHQSSHEEGKRWPCTQCGVTFISPSDLAVHEETHVGETLRLYAPCGANCICEPSLWLHFATPFGKENSGRDPQEATKPQWEMRGMQEARYSCHMCGLQFRLEENLGVHYRYCCKERLQKYRYSSVPSDSPKTCGKRVRNKLAPGASGNGSHSRPRSQASCGRWVCSSCGKSFVSRFILHKHKAQEHPRAARLGKNGGHTAGSGGRTLVGVMKKLHNCPKCGKRFVFTSQLLQHLKAHTEDNPCRPSLARESLGCNGSWEPHEMQSKRPHKHRQGLDTSALPVRPKRQGGKTPFRCAECGKSFAKCYFPTHQAWHTGLRFRCFLCGKTFNFQAGAYRHVQQHRQKRDFPTCPKCGDKDRSKHCLCLIDRIYIGQELPAPPCKQEGVGQPAMDSCGKHPSPSSPRQRILMGRKPGTHRVRGKDRPWRGTPALSCKSVPRRFQCMECGKNFVYEARLRMHHRTHTGEWPFQCAECGKGFSHKGYLSLHRKTHVRGNM